MKHQCLPGPPSKPCQSSQWKCLFEGRSVVMAAPALLPRHSRDPRSQKCHRQATARLQRWRKWGKVQIRATVALRVWQVKHQPDRTETGSNLRSEPRHLPLAEGTHGAGNTPAHTCTQPWQCPCPSTGWAQKQGYTITPVSPLFPFSNFYSAKVMHFRKSIQFD